MEQPDLPAVDARKAQLLPLAGLFLLLALAQILWGGYQLGIGNQSIQIPFLKQAINPALYTHDAAAATAADYPTWFFKALAPVVKIFGLAPTYFILHFLTAFATFATVYALCRAMFADHWTGIVAVLLLLAGHHRALAGDTLYSTGFTHTWAVFPFAIGALALFYAGRPILACLLAGILFNIHGLTGAYLFVMFAFWAIFNFRRIGLGSALLMLALFLLAAAPTLVLIISHHQTFPSEWITLTRVRSADHSFPSSWWRGGNPDLPRFLLLLAVGALSLSYRSRKSGTLSKTRFLTTAIFAMFAAGYVFADLVPLPAIMRAQLFRSSRILLILAFAHIAHAIVGGWRTSESRLPRYRETLEFINASLLFVCLAFPSLLLWLPVVVAISLLIALIDGRLTGTQALLTGATLIVTLLAWRTTHFPIPGLGGEISATAVASSLPRAIWLPLAIAAVLLLFARQTSRAWWNISLGATALLAASFIAYRTYPALTNSSTDTWIAVQQWAHDNSAPADIFLTPAQQNGFRIHSERAIVGEWRDGTQMYFSGQFSDTWWQRMRDLHAATEADITRSGIAPAHSIEQLSDADLQHLATEYSAAYVVLPANQTRVLPRLYTNSEWAVYDIRSSAPAATKIATNTNTPEPPKITQRLGQQSTLFQPALLAARETGSAALLETASNFKDVAKDVAQVAEDYTLRQFGGRDTEKYQQYFLQNTCEKNIDRYRKSDATLDITDATGASLKGVTYEIHQTRHAFNFACSLGFFQTPAASSQGDFKPPQVDPRELTRFNEIFNASQIPFSGKWLYTEPEEGVTNYEDLDKYVNWCTENHVEMEFHFLSGYAPQWLRRKKADEQAELFLKHSQDLIARYRDRIKYWQVVNERVGIAGSPAVFNEIRKTAPELKLGISDCSRFYSEYRQPMRDADFYRGLNEIRWFKKQGIQLDFFAFHGHRPFGVWTDVRQMYECLDTFAAEGVKVHITEFTVPQTSKIGGILRTGQWTPELQAEFYERYFTVCFSHPAVEFINLWGIGPVTWQEGSGLLDENYNPKPVFDRLKNLIQHHWHTDLTGTVPTDGTIKFRGFHGDYEVTIKFHDGRQIKQPFTIKPDTYNHASFNLLK